MSVEGVDYSSARPDPKKLYAAGKRFIVRYGGAGGSWKWIEQREADAARAAGLSIVANVEGTAGGLLSGRSAGVAWAKGAELHFEAIGMPVDRPVYLSIDIDPRNLSGTQWSALDAAMDRAADVLGRSRVGVYGGYAAIAHFVKNGKARWYWQTYAWSNGDWHARNHMRQWKNGVTVAGTSGLDLDTAMTEDYGQWGQPRPKPPQRKGTKMILGMIEGNATVYRPVDNGVVAMKDPNALKALIAAGATIATFDTMVQLVDAMGPLRTQ